MLASAVTAGNKLFLLLLLLEMYYIAIIWNPTFTRCEEQCSALLALVDEDILAVPHEQTAEASAATSSSFKSTVGIMVKETTIDELLFGGPAALSQNFERGDVILAVDGRDATREGT